MKAIEFNLQQIEAYENGATMFIIPIPDGTITISKESDSYNMIVENYGDTRIENVGLFSTVELALSYFKGKYAPLKKGDEFFIQEDFSVYDFPRVSSEPLVGYYEMWNNNLYVGDKTEIKDASQMQEHQPRYKDVCLNVEVKRFGEVLVSDITNCKMEKELITNTLPYKDSDYVFLITMKGIK